MSKKILNQNDIINTEIINSYDLDCIFGNKPINRVKNEPLTLNKAEELVKLKERIQNIENCELKNHGSKIVFADPLISAKGINRIKKNKLSSGTKLPSLKNFFSYSNEADKQSVSYL